MVPTSSSCVTPSMTTCCTCTSEGGKGGGEDLLKNSYLWIGSNALSHRLFPACDLIARAAPRPSVNPPPLSGRRTTRGEMVVVPTRPLEAGGPRRTSEEGGIGALVVILEGQKSDAGKV